MTYFNCISPLAAFGGGIVVSGSFFYMNVKDQKNKGLASIVMVLGIAILAGGLYQSIIDYQDAVEVMRYQKILLSIPTEGKLGELFAVFRDKVGVSRENFLDSGSSGEKPAMWGFDPKKWYHLFLQAKYLTSASITPVTIELIQDPLDSQGVISNVSLINSKWLFKDLNDYLVEQVSKVVPKVIDAFDRFLDGERIYDGSFYNISSLQITG